MVSASASGWRCAAAMAVAALLAAIPSARAETVSIQVAAALTVTGELYRPDGDGPFAAVVMLHGCSGPWKHWSEL